MSWWVWVLVCGALLAAEMVLGTDFFLVFFGVGALLLALLGLTGAELPLWGQLALFSAFSVGSLLVFRERLRNLWLDKRPYEELRGEFATAQSPMAAGALGRAELRGTLWQARNVGPEDLAPGDRCQVEAVDGLLLAVRRTT